MDPLALALYLLGAILMMGMCEDVFKSDKLSVLIISTTICCVFWPLITVFVIFKYVLSRKP